MPKKPTIVEGKFGKLEVIHCNLSPRKRVLVKCECSKEFAVTSYDLVSGRTTSCGASLCSTRAYNLIGKKYSLLTVKSLSKSKNDRGELVWICKCDCGKTRRVKTNNLINGLVKSCGCQSDILRAKALSKPTDDVLANSIWNQYKFGARSRNLSFQLTQAEVKEFLLQNCYYCNSLPIASFIIRSVFGDKTINYNGIDRKDSTIGYIKNNCVTCCKICNAAKSNYSISQFLDWAKKLVEYQKSLGSYE